MFQCVFTWWKRSPMILRKIWRVSTITCVNGIEINDSWIEPSLPLVVFFLHCSSYIAEDSSQLASLVLKENYKTECWSGKCQINIAFCIYSHTFAFCIYAIFYHLSYLCFLTCKHPQTDDGYPVSETCLFIMAMLVCEMVVRQNIAFFKFFLFLFFFEQFYLQDDHLHYLQH